MQGEEAIVKCGTSKGPIVMQLFRDWSPFGYDRATELFEKGFYDGSHFYRAVPGFLVQFGITYSQDENLRSFMRKAIPDDPQLEPRIPFGLGTVSFAGSGPNSRKTQLFISYKKSSKKLGTGLWETALGKVIHGIENAQQFYSYGDMPPWGDGPSQGKIYNGPGYKQENFPLTDRFETCTVQRINQQQQEQNESSSSSSSSSLFRINPPTRNNHGVLHVGVADSAETLLLQDGSISLLVFFSSANDGVRSRLGGALALVVIGLVMSIRSRRKTLSKTS